mgnify:CR=1 FL=1
MYCSLQRRQEDKARTPIKAVVLWGETELTIPPVHQGLFAELFSCQCKQQGRCKGSTHTRVRVKACVLYADKKVRTHMQILSTRQRVCAKLHIRMSLCVCAFIEYIASCAGVGGPRAPCHVYTMMETDRTDFLEEEHELQQQIPSRLSIMHPKAPPIM